MYCTVKQPRMRRTQLTASTGTLTDAACTIYALTFTAASWLGRQRHRRLDPCPDGLLHAAAPPSSSGSSLVSDVPSAGASHHAHDRPHSLTPTAAAVQATVAPRPVSLTPEALAAAMLPTDSTRCSSVLPHPTVASLEAPQAGLQGEAPGLGREYDGASDDHVFVRSSCFDQWSSAGPA